MHSTRSSPGYNQRWNAGLTDAAALHAELQAQGWMGSVQAVRRYVRPFRQLAAAPPPAPAVPKTRQITGWLLSRPASLDPGDRAQLAPVPGGGAQDPVGVGSIQAVCCPAGEFS